MKPSNANLVDQDSPRSASPAMGVWVAAKIAEIRRIELDDVLIQVRKNVTNMYGIWAYKNREIVISLMVAAWHVFIVTLNVSS